MTTPAPRLEAVEPDRLLRIEESLRANGLPYRDIHDEEVVIFEFGYEDRMIGVGGLEGYDSVGLLRSIVIKESYRGMGHGKRLVRAIEDVARNEGIETLFLLTTSASSYFRDLEYREIPRSEMPPEIRKTEEFSDLCPTSATCMRKQV